MSTNIQRPVRLITYAWGDKYINELLTLTLPAVLAQGNLPALADAFQCEFVLLTAKVHFSTVQAAPSFRKLQSICEAKLIEIDDLVFTTAAYGHSLTWTHFRGFEDLGDAVTETNLLFFTADWIPADGSYRSLIKPLQNGDRLIVSPSYCAISEDIIPLLREKLDAEQQTLSIQPRELAELAIKYRHNSIRGKTINQNLFHMDVPDQFYYLVDNETMLSRQMPIAIVCMRPERRLTEPTTFWDYGAISELCPTSVPLVLSDSDDFLMLELRGKTTYSEGLNFGGVSRERIINKLGSFTTKDHHDYGRHTLVLHSKNLPTNYHPSRKEFDDYVDSILDALPPPVPYLNHPYWTGMALFYDSLRSAYLQWRKHEGTNGKCPPSAAELASLQIKLINESRIQSLQRFFSASDTQDPVALESARREWEIAHARISQQISAVGHIANILESYSGSATIRLKQQITRSSAALDQLRNTVYGTTPEVEEKSIDVSMMAYNGSSLKELMKTSSNVSFSTRCMPFFTSLKPLFGLLKQFTESDKQSILTVSRANYTFAAKFVRQLPGSHNQISLERLLHVPNHSLDGKQFDLCVFDAVAEDAVEFSAICDFLRPFMRNRATIIFFALNRNPIKKKSLTPGEMILGMFPILGDVQAHYSGSFGSGLASYGIRLAQAVNRRLELKSIAMANTIFCSLLALWSYHTDSKKDTDAGGALPKFWTSAVISVKINS
jgi:hypothetical protein